jgi:di/tricarboxylate transporter
MLTDKEIAFIAYWEKNRNQQQKSFVQYLKGFYRGLAVGVGIIVLVALGWDERATMVANSKMSTLVFMVALLCIAIFMAWLYQNFQWEMKEQQYLELLAKKKHLETPKP